MAPVHPATQSEWTYSTILSISSSVRISCRPNGGMSDCGFSVVASRICSRSFDLSGETRLHREERRTDGTRQRPAGHDVARQAVALAAIECELAAFFDHRCRARVGRRAQPCAECRDQHDRRQRRCESVHDGHLRCAGPSRMRPRPRTELSPNRRPAATRNDPMILPRTHQRRTSSRSGQGHFTLRSQVGFDRGHRRGLPPVVVHTRPQFSPLPAVRGRTRSHGRGRSRRTRRY